MFSRPRLQRQPQQQPVVLQLQQVAQRLLQVAQRLLQVVQRLPQPQRNAVLVKEAENGS